MENGSARGNSERAGGATSNRRTVGSRRGEMRRQALLARVTEDLAQSGLVGFSLRRAARAAGTTHKVLLYHFDTVDDLLAQAVFQLRDRRVARGLGAISEGGLSVAAKVRAMWPILTSDEGPVLDQAIGLMLYDPARYGHLGAGASEQYLASLVSMCPEHWSEARKVEVAKMVLATLRGLLIERLTGDDRGVEAGFEALTRALDREEASAG